MKKFAIIFLTLFFKFSTANSLITVDITRGNLDPLPIAVSPLHVDIKSHEIPDIKIKELGEKVSQIIEKNFKSTGLFNPLKKEAFVQKPDIAHLKPRFEDWALIKAQALITGKVTFSEITGPIRIKNTDLSNTTTELNGAGELTVHSPTIHISNDELDDMTSYILSTGKVPNGTYVFKFALKSPGECGGTIDNWTRDVEIYEPTFLDLLSPGFNSFSDANDSPIFSSFPVFTWNSDVCSGCNYKIRVCEYNNEEQCQVDRCGEVRAIKPILPRKT